MHTCSGKQKRASVTDQNVKQKYETCQGGSSAVALKKSQKTSKNTRKQPDWKQNRELSICIKAAHKCNDQLRTGVVRRKNKRNTWSYNNTQNYDGK